MDTKRLGKTDIFVSALGLGTGPMCKQGRPPKDQAIAIIHRALDLGITFIDTADVYCIDEYDKHYGEHLIHQALKSYPGDISKVIISTRGGCLRVKGKLVENGNPDYLRQAIHDSFIALGGKKPIDLWMLHRIDPKYSLKDSLMPAKQALEKGTIRAIGISNVSIEQLRFANQFVPISAVQNQYSLWHRKNEFNGVLSYCDQSNITFIPWGSLGGVGGTRRTKKIENLDLLEKFSEKYEVSVYCILLAWLREKSPNIIPIPGASKQSSIEDSVRSMEFSLSPAEVDSIDKLVPGSPLDRGIFEWLKRQIKQFQPV